MKPNGPRRGGLPEADGEGRLLTGWSRRTGRRDVGTGSRGVRRTIGRLSAGWAEPRRVDWMLASRTTAGSSGVRPRSGRVGQRGVDWTLTSRKPT